MKKFSSILLPVFLFSLFVGFAGCGGPAEAQKDYTVIAKCLTEKGVKMYGSITCPHCTAQKKNFGEAFKYINYIECDPHTDLQSAKQCNEDNIEYLPTWRFSDGTEVVGLQDIEALGLRVGCEMPAGETAEETEAEIIK
jgi:glutaredoxin